MQRLKEFLEKGYVPVFVGDIRDLNEGQIIYLPKHLKFKKGRKFYVLSKEGKTCITTEDE